MEIFSHVNWLHVLVATIGYFMLGAIWYSALFQKPWLRYHKIIPDEMEKKSAGAIMAFSFILFFIITLGLAVLVSALGLRGAVPGIKLGLLTGVCFSAMALSISYLYVQKPLGLVLIDGGYHICGQIIAAIILCVWQ